MATRIEREQSLTALMKQASALVVSTGAVDWDECCSRAGDWTTEPYATYDRARAAHNRLVAEPSSHE